MSFLESAISLFEAALVNIFYINNLCNICNMKGALLVTLNGVSHCFGLMAHKNLKSGLGAKIT